mgnify:CR=1 FL=1
MAGAWLACHRQSAALVKRFGLTDEELLARLLFDVLFSDSEAVAVTTGMVLTASPIAPWVTSALAAVLVEQPTEVPDEVDRAWMRIVGMKAGTSIPELPSDLVDRGSAAEVAVLCVRACAGEELTRDELRDALLRHPADARRIIFAAGMSGSEVLEDFAASSDPAVAGAAGWWLSSGGRIDR